MDSITTRCSSRPSADEVEEKQGFVGPDLRFRLRYLLFLFELLG